MTLNDVAVESPVGPHGKLQVDEGSFFNPRERRAVPGFLGKIGAEGFGRDFNRSEADSTDGNTAAFLQLFRKFRTGDGDPAVAFVSGYAGNVPNFLNDAGEHESVQREIS